MNCPECGRRGFSMSNGCSGCGRYPTQQDIEREDQHLRGLVKETVARSTRSREWAGVDGPREPVSSARDSEVIDHCEYCGADIFRSGYSRHECKAMMEANK